jgi:hypothetical protein
VYRSGSSVKLPKSCLISLGSLNLKGTWILSRRPPRNWLEGQPTPSKEARELWGLGSHSPHSRGCRGGSGFLRGNWECLRSIPFFRCVFTNHGQGLSTSLTLFHPLGMFFKKKEQLYIGDFCPFALPLAKQV